MIKIIPNSTKLFTLHEPGRELWQVCCFCLLSRKPTLLILNISWNSKPVSDNWVFTKSLISFLLYPLSSEDPINASEIYCCLISIHPRDNVRVHLRSERIFTGDESGKNVSLEEEGVSKAIYVVIVKIIKSQNNSKITVNKFIAWSEKSVYNL